MLVCILLLNNINIKCRCRHLLQSQDKSTERSTERSFKHKDTGCSSAAVRRDLVQPEQMTGKVHICKLFDSSLRQYPIARIHVDTPYYKGEVEAMVVKKPICDLIIGNIPGARNLWDSEM